jgi:hypothetical protein
MSTGVGISAAPVRSDLPDTTLAIIRQPLLGAYRECPLCTREDECFPEGSVREGRPVRRRAGCLRSYIDARIVDRTSRFPDPHFWRRCKAARVGRNRYSRGRVSGRCPLRQDQQPTCHRNGQRQRPRSHDPSLQDDRHAHSLLSDTACQDPWALSRNAQPGSKGILGGDPNRISFELQPNTDLSHWPLGVRSMDA